jgi:hypothetical protein
VLPKPEQYTAFGCETLRIRPILVEPGFAPRIGSEATRLRRG